MFHQERDVHSNSGNKLTINSGKNKKGILISLRIQRWFLHLI